MGSVEFQEPSMADNYRSYYEIFVGSYADSNGDGVGDLKGIEQKLDYIKELGFRGIWLTPIFQSPSYHKYNTSDYFAIDPSFGTMADLKSLVQACHKDNIKIILDLAINHSSRQNEMYQKAVASYAFLKNEASDSEKELIKDLSEQERKNYAGLYSFSPTNASQGSAVYRQVANHTFYVEATFDDDMPEFNFDSAFAQDYFKKIIDFYMNDSNAGVDGFRLDAVKYYYMNDQAKNYEALNKIESYVKANDSNGYVVAENWSDSQSIADYYQHTDIDSYFYFPGQGQNGFTVALLKYIAPKEDFVNGQNQMVTMSGENIPAPFLDNHDTNRMSKSNLNMAKFLYGSFATISGNTFTYYGDEVGIQQKQGVSNDKVDPSKRTHMPWGDGMECNDPASDVESTYLFGSVKDQLADKKSLVNYVKRANQIRLALPEIAEGTIVGNSDLEDPSNILTIDKKLGKKTVRIVYNISKDSSETYTDNEDYTRRYELTNDGKEVKSSGKTYTLPSMSILFLEKESEA